MYPGRRVDTSSAREPRQHGSYAGGVRSFILHRDIWQVLTATTSLDQSQRCMGGSNPYGPIITPYWFQHLTRSNQSAVLVATTQADQSERRIGGSTPHGPIRSLYWWQHPTQTNQSAVLVAVPHTDQLERCFGGSSPHRPTRALYWWQLPTRSNHNAELVAAPKWDLSYWSNGLVYNIYYMNFSSGNVLRGIKNRLFYNQPLH